MMTNTSDVPMITEENSDFWPNSTSPETDLQPPKWPDLPVFGLPGHVFNLIHISALASLAVSVVFSVGVLASFAYGCQPFYRRTIAERLVVYLAVADVGQGISHSLDHGYMMAVRYHPPDAICAAFAFFLGEFTVAQSFVVCFTAVNAFILVVKEIRVSLGKYDWRFLLGVFGLPAAGFIPLTALGMMGQSGAWCYSDLRKPSGIYVTNTLSAIFLITFVANVVCYVLVWAKIQRVTRATQGLGGRSGENSYTKTAKCLLMFVVAYTVQWSFFLVYSIWSLFAVPNVASIIAVVILCNLGGLFNFLAYSLIRRRLRVGNKGDKSSSSSGVKSTSNVSSLTEV